MSFKTSFRWNKTPKTIINELVGNTQVRLFAANEAKKLMEPYTPGDSLDMSRGARAYVQGGKAIVEYPGPYSRFQYYGKVMIGKQSRSAWANKYESKIVTGRNLKHSKFRHPLATSKWDVAMKRARGDDLARAIQNYIKKKG